MEYDASLSTALLARAPAILRAMLEDLPEEWLDAPERPGAWSPREVAAHMADLERDAWLPRARWILEHGATRPLPPVDRERFRETLGGAPLAVVLDTFAEQRSGNLEALRDMLPIAADTRGVHANLGNVRLSELLSTWVVHDLTHFAQIQRALAAQYRTAVGPWERFLSVLHRPSPPA